MSDDMISDMEEDEESDVIRCGACHGQYRLEDLEAFLKHKQDGCGSMSSIKALQHYSISTGRQRGQGTSLTAVPSLTIYCHF